MGALGARVFFGIPLAFTLCRVDVRRVVVFEATCSRNRTDLIYYYILDVLSQWAMSALLFLGCRRVLACRLLC